MRKQTISIVIPNFNGENLFKQHLPSVIAASKNPQNKIKEIIVVDDGSSDNSVALLKKHYPEIKIIRHSRNKGFSTTVNTGVRSASGNLVVLLNTDVSVSKNFVVPTLKHFEDNLVFGVSFHERGYGRAKGKFENGFFEHSGMVETSISEITMWVSGGSGIFRKDYYTRIGGLDDKLFSPYYWEDVDLCYRAWKRGYKCIWEPDSNVVHEHEGTTGKILNKKKIKIQERNQLFVMWKNFSSSNILKKHVFGLIKRCIKHPGYILVVMMALSKLPQVISFRKKEKKEIKVSDEAIFAQFK